MTKHLAVALLVALVVIGCDSSEDQPPQLPSGPVPILTGFDPTMGNGTTKIGCMDLSFTGLLKADPKWGTTIAFDVNSAGVGTVPVMWVTGFSARRIGTEIGIYNRKNKLVAITGRRWMLLGGSNGAIRQGRLGDIDVQLDIGPLFACDVVPPPR